MRNRIVWITALAVLAVVNFAAWQKEQVLGKGQTVLLELAPVDPRSLLQGDYMALNYRVANDIRLHLQAPSVDGVAVVALDPEHKGQFVRIQQPGEALQANETLIRFRKRGSVVRIGAEAFFFQEGQGSVYRPAKYGELKVAADGEVVLVGLRDAEGKVLQAKSK
jgi:uncharacterized membrane-anchored protein